MEILRYDILRNSPVSVKAKLMQSEEAVAVSKLKVMTWNVWFADIEFTRRMQYILETTMNIFPDVVCYQEVLPEFAEMVRSNPLVMEYYLVSPFNTTSYGVLTLVKTILKPVFEIFEFPTEMERELLRVNCTINGGNFAVGNVHLESLNNQSIRTKQLEVCNRALSGYDSAVLVGDFNFCSERNFHHVPGIPLENDALTTIMPAFVDVWPVLADSGNISVFPSAGLAQPLAIAGDGAPADTACVGLHTPTKICPVGKRSGQLSSISRRGYTFDSDLNPMITKYERMRYDRVVAKLAPRQGPVHISLVGTDPIDANAILLLNGRCAPAVRGLWPSDHFGLVCTIDLILSREKPDQHLQQRQSGSSGTAVPIVLSKGDEPNAQSADMFGNEEEGEDTVGVSREKPSQSVISAGDLRTLKLDIHSHGSVETNGDGGRHEKRDAEEYVTLEPVTSSNCRMCAKFVGFVMNSSDDICGSCREREVANFSEYIPYEEIEARANRLIRNVVTKAENPLRLLAIDFDATICQIHTYGRWSGSSSALAAHVRPVFRAILKVAVTVPNLRIGVVTFSGQNAAIRQVLEEIVGTTAAGNIFIRGATNNWTVPAGHTCMEGKQPHIASILQEMFFDTGVVYSPQQVLLIDDDRKNCRVALRFNHKAVVFPALPLPGIDMRGPVEAAGVIVLHRCQLRHGALLCISKGSVVDFAGFEQGAIVNAANTGGLGGGGVDAAISSAGGDALLEARKALPVLEGSKFERIPEGRCRSTGPGQFGRLRVPYVLHAVGPDYNRFLYHLPDGRDMETALQEGDDLLRSAYECAMECAFELDIDHIGFSLLSAGIFRGHRSLREVLTIGVEAVASCAYEGLREVHLIGFTPLECDTLINIVTGRESGVVPAAIQTGAGRGSEIRAFLNDLESVAAS